MQINNISPPPIDNDPPPSDEKQKVARQQFISVPVWGSFKTWLATELRAAVNQILQVLQNFVNANGTVTINENVTINGSLNGLSPVPGMAQMRDGGKYEFLGGARTRLLTWTPTVIAITGSFTFGIIQGFYYQSGNIVYIQFLVNIATFTTPGLVQFSLPPNLPLGAATVMTGRENAVSGYQLYAYNNTATTMAIAKYDATNSVTAVNDQLLITGCYYTP